MFSPEEILSTQTEAGSTEFIVVPDGEWPAVVKDIKVREAGEYTFLDINWTIDSEEVSNATGRDSNTVRQSMFLDISESGGLDMSKGKNVDLNRTRDALGQNTGGWSPSMLIGQAARVRTEQRLYEGKTYVDVKGVSSLR